MGGGGQDGCFACGFIEVVAREFGVLERELVFGHADGGHSRRAAGKTEGIEDFGDNRGVGEEGNLRRRVAHFGQVVSSLYGALRGSHRASWTARCSRPVFGLSLRPASDSRAFPIVSRRRFVSRAAVVAVRGVMSSGVGGGNGTNRARSAPTGGSSLTGRSP